MKNVIIIYLVLGSLYSSLSSAFTLTNNPPYTFGSDTITIDYNESSCSGVFSGYTVADLVRGAVNEYWGTVPWTRLRFKTGSDTTTAAASAENGHIVISCGAVPAGAAAYGGPSRTAGYTTQTGFAVLGAVMGNYTLASATITTAHEIGHALGLGHSSHADSVMYGGGGSGRGLSDDDESGLTYLYPQFEEAFINCVTVRSVHNQKPPYEAMFLLALLLIFQLSLRTGRLRLR